MVADGRSRGAGRGGLNRLDSGRSRTHNEYDDGDNNDNDDNDDHDGSAADDGDYCTTQSAMRRVEAVMVVVAMMILEMMMLKVNIK